MNDENTPTQPQYRRGEMNQPPPYESLFVEIKEARKNANGEVHFLKTVYSIIKNSSKFDQTIACDVKNLHDTRG